MVLTIHYFIGLLVGYVAHSALKKTGLNYVLKPVMKRYKKHLLTISVLLSGLIYFNML